MSDTTPPAKDASVEEIEADIAATRERLAESVDALADKVNVKARAQEKAEQTKEQAREKLDQAKTKGQDLLGQARQASRPVQLALVSVPIVVIVLLIVKAVRGRRS
jgi:flagellar biosynthesis GTPase FlhF